MTLSTREAIFLKHFIHGNLSTKKLVVRPTPVHVVCGEEAKYLVETGGLFYYCTTCKREASENEIVPCAEVPHLPMCQERLSEIVAEFAPDGAVHMKALELIERETSDTVPAVPTSWLEVCADMIRLGKYREAILLMFKEDKNTILDLMPYTRAMEKLHAVVKKFLEVRSTLANRGDGLGLTLTVRKLWQELEVISHNVDATLDAIENGDVLGGFEEISVDGKG